MNFNRRNGLILRNSEHPDILPIASNMRKADVAEIKASHGYNPFEALEVGIRYSRICLTAEFKGTPIAMFGAVETPPFENGKNFLLGTAQIWMLGTPEVEKIWICFGLVSKKVITYLLQYYQKLFNYVDVRNEKSVKWLTWCGAKFHDAVPYGPENQLFRYFYFEREVKV